LFTKSYTIKSCLIKVIFKRYKLNYLVDKYYCKNIEEGVGVGVKVITRTAFTVKERERWDGHE
jgi:hypothetical protein